MCNLVRRCLALVFAACFLVSGIALAHCKVMHITLTKADVAAAHHHGHGAAAQDHSGHHYQADNGKGDAPADRHAVDDKCCALCTMSVAPVLDVTASFAGLCSAPVQFSAGESLIGLEVPVDPGIPKRVS